MKNIDIHVYCTRDGTWRARISYKGWDGAERTIRVSEHRTWKGLFLSVCDSLYRAAEGKMTWNS